jgi:hypothetical protein
MEKETDWTFFIYINIQIRKPYEDGNDARRNEEKEESKCVVIVI